MPSSSLTSSIGVRPGTRSEPSAQLLDPGRLDVVLVGDLADDLLEQVLERDEPGGAAVLVDTIAMWNCWVCISRSSSATRFCSGTNTAGRTALAHRLRRRRPRARGATRSFRYTSPTMLSVAALARGEPREARARSRLRCASSIVSSASIATMSGRGSITSRTTVSPNSKIEWMSRRSSRSIDLLARRRRRPSCGGPPR